MTRAPRPLLLIALAATGCGSVPGMTWLPLVTRPVPVPATAPPGEVATPQPGLVFRHHIEWGPIAPEDEAARQGDEPRPVRSPGPAEKGAPVPIVRRKVTLWGAVPGLMGGEPGLMPVRIVLRRESAQGESRELPLSASITRWEAGELRMLLELDGEEAHAYLPDDPFTCDQFTAEPEHRQLWPIELTFARATGGTTAIAAWVEEFDALESQAARAHLEGPPPGG